MSKKKLWIEFKLLGFDKNSSATFTKRFYATGNESFEKSFQLFQEEIPFHNWYYELEIPNRDAYEERTLDQVFGETMLGLKL